MAKAFTLILGILILISGSTHAADSFQNKPVTQLIGGFTAYTLGRGAFLVTIQTSGPMGLLGFTGGESPFGWPGLARLDYGVTNNLQLETIPLVNFTGLLNLSARYKLIHLPSSQIDITAHTAIAHSIGEYTTLGGCGILSWGVMDTLGIHPSFCLATIRSSAMGFTVSSNTIGLILGADFNILRNAKVLGELTIGKTFVGDYMTLDITDMVTGGLIRLWDFLDVTLIMNIPPTEVAGRISVRF